MKLEKEIRIKSEQGISDDAEIESLEKEIETL